jgi:hypothetical protein
MPRPTFRVPLRQSSGRPRTAHSLSALGIELHGLVSYPEALALAQARSFLRLHPSFDPVLIMNLEQTRIRVDVLCPRLLHHRPLVSRRWRYRTPPTAGRPRPHARNRSRRERLRRRHRGTIRIRQPGTSGRGAGRLRRRARGRLLAETLGPEFFLDAGATNLD